MIFGTVRTIAEAIKQLNDENVYKSVKFKDKILQDPFSKVLSRKVELLKNN